MKSSPLIPPIYLSCFILAVFFSWFLFEEVLGFRGGTSSNPTSVTTTTKFIYRDLTPLEADTQHHPVLDKTTILFPNACVITSTVDSTSKFLLGSNIEQFTTLFWNIILENKDQHAEIEFNWLGSDDAGDHYHFRQRFHHLDNINQATDKYIIFTGQEQQIFKTDFHTVTISPVQDSK